MKEWKQRGFVQDSDDEEDITSIESESLPKKDTQTVETQEREDIPPNGEAADSLVEQEVCVTTEVAEGVRGENAEFNLEKDDAVQAPKGGTDLGIALSGKDVEQNAASSVIQDIPYDAPQDNNNRHNVAVSRNPPNVETPKEQASKGAASRAISSAESSPLSQLSSPPMSSVELDLDMKPTKMVPRIPESRVQVVVPSQELSRAAARGAADIPPEYWLARSLRQRKAEQLHPYQIELQRYKQAMRARGVKPVNVAATGEPVYKRNHYEDTQSQEPTEESQDNAFTPSQASSDELAHSSPPHRHGPLSSSVSPFPVINEEEEFPTVDAILNRQVQGGVLVGHKRRKTHQYSAKRATILQEQTRQAVQNIADRREDIFNIPPSPPTPRASCPHSSHGVYGRGFRMPPGMSPAHQVTPATSIMTGLPSPGLVQNVLDDDLSPISARRHSGQIRMESITYVSSSESSGTESSSDDSAEIRRLQRRIKGVLPASWLRFDQQAQKQRQRERESPHPTVSSRTTPEPQKGVAKRINKSVHHRSLSELGTVVSTPAIVLSDESDTASSRVPSKSSVPDPASRTILSRAMNDSFDFMLDVDDMEDDSIDMMLPSTTRHRSSTKAGKKRQVKLTETFSGPTKRLKTDLGRAISASTHSVRHKKSKSHSKQSKAAVGRVKKVLPRLSIVDAPSTPDTESAPVPAFLKVARRQARKKPDQGRHSPTGKLIRLRTAADTEDANSVLRNWRANKISQRRWPVDPGGHDFRTPLTERSNNQQQRWPSPLQILKPADAVRLDEHPDLQALKRRSTQLLKSIPRQTKLGHLISKRVHLPERYEPIGKTSPTKEKSQKGSRPTLKKTSVYRPGALEGLESEFNIHHPRSAFEKVLGRQARHLADVFTQGPKLNLQLQRFLADDNPFAGSISVNRNTRDPVAVEKPDAIEHWDAIPKPISRRQPRKRAARRLDTEAREYRQPSEPVSLIEAPESSVISFEATENDTLIGIGQYGTRYPVDFDIRPLALGTFFHNSTFIGNGELSDCLNFKGRDLDISSGYYTFEVNGIAYKWSSWVEDVSAGMTDVLQSLRLKIEDIVTGVFCSGATNQPAETFMQVRNTLRNLISYLSECLSFLDPPDRRQFVTHVLDQLHPLFRSLPSIANIPIGEKVRAKRIADIVKYLLLLTYQIVHISQHSTVDVTSRTEAASLLKLLAEQLMRYITVHGTPLLREFLESNRRHSIREAGIRDESVAVECVVVLWHVSIQEVASIPSFWKLFNEQVQTTVIGSRSVPTFERVWQDIFTLLALLEFDTTGVVSVGVRYKKSREDWSLLKAMLGRVFTLYADTARGHASTLNDYIRCLLTRCHRLVQDWGWKKCEQMLNIIFDFFAKNGLAPMQNEECHGSPRFLEELDKHPSLAIQPDDRSFHIFLKTLATGLRSMRSVYTDKKIYGLTYRFVPNHGRTCRKDQSVQQEDIDALRNHHDLLCVLYWASPPGFRPKLSLLRNLVDHTTSHREACRLNVGAWTRLVTYQLSTEEDVKLLEPLAAWCCDIMLQTIAQYRLARTEAEGQYEHAKAQGNILVSSGLLHSTISRNQGQVLATLTDVVTGMKNALRATKEKAAASMLLAQSHILDVFKLFDARNSRVADLIVEALCVIEEYGKIVNPSKCAVTEESQTSSEESQDYGEFPDLDYAFTMDIDLPKTTEADPVHEPLAELLSSCFGAETSPSDSLLTKVVDVWVDKARQQVQVGEKRWDNYLDQYSQLSWHQLRDTEQRRKYETYFMSLVLEADRSSYIGQETTFMTAWLLSLVERESMLKYQHRFTATLLSVNPSSLLLQNLPFVTTSRSRISISLKDFRERRLSVISSVLSNMRASFELTMRNNPQELTALRSDYSALIKRLMATMKSNYLELQQGDTVKGAYVSFVQKVVEFLQQYATDICPIDKFFTDSSAFPLPHGDPTYVVGRLKSYGLKLDETKTLKQSVVFLQTVSERAAVDGQQEYLVNQLCAAVKGSYERGDVIRPSLRRVLLQAIFPAYIQQSLRTASGWIIARPILQASTRMLKELPYVFSMVDEGSTRNVLAMVDEMLCSLRNAVELFIEQSSLLAQPHILDILALIVNAVTVLIPCVDYINRRTGLAENALAHIEYFKSFTFFIAETLLDGTSEPFPLFDDYDNVCVTMAQPFVNIRQHCTRELDRALRENWMKTGDTYVFQKGGVRKEVLVDLGNVDEEKERVEQAIVAFHEALETVTRDEDGSAMQSVHRGDPFGIAGMII